MKFNKLMLSLTLFSASSLAQPWISSNDAMLRASIEMLVNQGIINQPVNTYPLMWQGIARDLAQLDSSQLNEQVFFAYQHVKHALEFAKQGSSSGFRANYNSAPELSQSFGERNQQQSGINSYGSITGDRVSAKVSVNYADQALDKKYINYHGSYLAVLFGNWSVSVEQVDHWWGPSNDNALMLSNNAAPMEGLRFTRANSQYVGPNWLSFIGNWQLTGIYAKQKPIQDQTNDGNYWALRLASTPINGLEVAISSSGSDFLTTTSFKQATLDENIQQTEHRLSSIDVKYSTSLFNQPIAVYSELMGKSKSGILPSSPFYTLGVESYFGSSAQLTKAYLEYSNTQELCELDCTYGNNYQTLQQGSYTQKSRLIGSSTPQNSQSWVLGAQYFSHDGFGAYTKLRYISAESVIGNLNNQYLVQRFKRLQLETGYQQGVFNGLWKVAGSIYQDELGDESNTDTALKTSWEYRF
ncbi:capsule assembly Wzi family protein [Pseudoalteromonas sp.]|uniref:capsule assembly Wzi family protein n=1 Tax=Pseudoalteromonas sp. TaxID=53249 RepID=UPI003F94E4FC